MKYEQPFIEMISIDACLLSGSGPDATSIGSPNVDDYAKRHSVWDEVNDTYNINKEEQDYEENWI